MSYNKESKEVDFTIGEIKITEADKIAFSQAIQKHKAKAAKKAARKKAVATKKQANDVASITNPETLRRIEAYEQNRTKG